MKVFGVETLRVEVTAVDPLTGHPSALDVSGLVDAIVGVEVGGHRESEADDPMTPAEFRMVRSRLGLSQDEFGLLLGLWSDSSTGTQRDNARRRVRRYESGSSFVPDKVRVAIEQLELVFTSLADELAGRLEEAGDVVLTIPGTDGVYPSGWWLAVAGEVTARVPGVTVRYASNVLHVQTWVPQLDDHGDEVGGSWETIDAFAHDSLRCPEVDLDPIDVGAGQFRLALRTPDGDVLDTSEVVTLDWESED